MVVSRGCGGVEPFARGYVRFPEKLAQLEAPKHLLILYFVFSFHFIDIIIDIIIDLGFEYVYIRRIN